MSAEPAHPGHDRHAPLAPVISLARPRRSNPRSERTPVPIQPDGQLGPHERLAASLESKLAAVGRSLTDENTAAGLTVALTEVRRLLEGARLQGLISEDGYRELDTMVEAMLMAPALLS